MLARSWVERVQDILDAIAEIEVFTQGMTFDVLRCDAKTIKAVELDFIVIGEAATRVPADVQAAHPEIPWHLMQAMRNRLVHAYFFVDPQILWDTIEQDLPPLSDALTKLLDEAGN